MVAQVQHRSGSSRAQALAAHAGRWRTRASDAGVGGADARRVSSRSMINEMMLCKELFHTPTGVAFADFITDGHRETWPIRSKSFRNWVRRCYYQATGAAAGAAMIGSALNLLEARAQFDAAERAVNIRVAEHDGRLYLDLADEPWRAVAIGPDGWRVLGCPPVRFRRSPGMLPLPVPERGGSIEVLRSFLNLSSQNDLVLIVAGVIHSSNPCSSSWREQCSGDPPRAASLPATLSPTNKASRIRRPARPQGNERLGLFRDMRGPTVAPEVWGANHR